MRDSDPRPMPPEVQRAYRDPVDLRGLLELSVFRVKDRMNVRDALLRSLLEKYGDVWVLAGSKEVRVSSLFKRTKSAASAVEFLLSVEEYGGSEEVLPLLAQAMQPHWAQWWESFEWNGSSSVERWRDVASHVLGDCQLAWLAAQYARTVIDRTGPQYRSVCVNAIEAAETWSRVPSEANRAKAWLARAAAAKAYYASAYASAPSTAAEATSANAANATVNAAATGAAYYATYAAAAAVSAASAAEAADAERFTFGADADADAYDRLADLTRILITPTLVTSAARSSGVARVRSSGA